MTKDLKNIAREAVKAADAYLAGARDPQGLHEAAASADDGLRSLGHEVTPARLREALHILFVSMERTSSRGGTHEVRWRNVMHAMAMVVRMELGEGLHPEDLPRDCVYECRNPDGSVPDGTYAGGRAWCRTHGFDCPGLRAPIAPPGQSSELRLLLTVARVLRATLREMAPNAEGAACPVGDDIAALNEALAPFDPAPGEPINEKAEG